MDINEFIRQNEEKELLRFSTAGSIDDGKSTLIGRLLHDSKLLFEDHLSALKHDSKKRGSAQNEMDFALLLDGLRSEREQNITIDVAYRYFSTPNRKFIIADTPGHEQYTRNMATGASTADMAIILIDARKGVITQSKRHTFIMSLLGISHLVVAVNKMDLVGYNHKVFEGIKRDYSEFIARLDIHDIHFIPISALVGDNVVKPSKNMPWFHGRPLIEYLENVHITSDRNLVDLRFPVQYVLRPNQDFRGYCGTVVSGIIRPGSEIMVLPSGRRSRVKSLVTYDGELEEVFPPQAVTITLEDELDISRGDMLVHIHNLPAISNTIEAMIVWMNDDPLKVSKHYIIKHTMNLIRGEISELRYKVNVNTLRRQSAVSLKLNEIGRVVLTLNKPLLYDVYTRNRATGCFILIDPLTNVTVGAGMIIDRRPNELINLQKISARPKSSDISPHESLVSFDERMDKLKQRPVTVWFTGLPKSGKTTTAYALERRLFDMGYSVHVLDGENMRLGISNNLGFSGKDRSENIRRATEVAKVFNGVGFITIAAFIFPYKTDREKTRKSIGEDMFIEIYLNAPLDVCESRDDKGLYERARKGEIKNFSGISAPYEPPSNPHLTLPTHEISVDEVVNRIVQVLRERNFIK